MRSRIPFSLVFCLLIAAIASGCVRRPVLTPSSFYNSFDPVALVEQEPGFAIPNANYRTANTTNPVEGYAWREWGGTITAPPGQQTIHRVAKRFQQEVERASAGRSIEEGSLSREPKSYSTLERTIFQYNTPENRHGEVHIWFFPAPDEATVNFVIYLREEPLR